MTRFNSYTRRGGFFIYCIETNTESNRMKKQKNMLQMKEQDKISGENALMKQGEVVYGIKSSK